MRTILIVVLVCVIGMLTGAPATAQIPRLEIFYDQHMFDDWGGCPSYVGQIDTLYIGAVNLNMWLSTIDFRIEYPPGGTPLVWLTDVHYSPLALGISPTGVTITFPTPRNAFQPTFVMRAVVMWVDAHSNEATNVVVHTRPHPGKTSVEAIRWPDYQVTEVVNLSGILCPVISTEETTWGRIKALYR